MSNRLLIPGSTHKSFTNYLSKCSIKPDLNPVLCLTYEKIHPTGRRVPRHMNEELESELENLKKQKVVSEETAMIYLSELRKKLNSEGNNQDEKN